MGKPLLIKERVDAEDQIILVDKFWFRLDDRLDGRFALRVVRAVFLDEKLMQVQEQPLWGTRQRPAARSWRWLVQPRVTFE